MARELATFSGGCFWCMVVPFEAIPGVKKITGGFTGGDMENPTYKQVAMGETDHMEAVQIEYDSELCTYEQLLNVFWRQIDPTDDEGQFIDRGYMYLTAIHYHNEEQKAKAEQSKKALNESGLFDKPIVTEILPAVKFYPAEEDQQEFYKKNPGVYCEYRKDSGRDEFIEKMWNTKH